MHKQTIYGVEAPSIPISESHYYEEMSRGTCDNPDPDFMRSVLIGKVAECAGCETTIASALAQLASLEIADIQYTIETFVDDHRCVVKKLHDLVFHLIDIGAALERKSNTRTAIETRKQISDEMTEQLAKAVLEVCGETAKISISEDFAYRIRPAVRRALKYGADRKGPGLDKLKDAARLAKAMQKKIGVKSTFSP